MPIKCPACGEDNRDGARICELCRALFDQPTPQSQGPTDPPIDPGKVIHLVPMMAAPSSRGWGTLLVAGAVGAALALSIMVVLKRDAPPAPPPAAPAQIPSVAESRMAPPVAARERVPFEEPSLAVAVPVLPEARPAKTMFPQPPPPASDGEGDRPRQISIRYKAFAGGARRILVPVTVNGSGTVMMAVDTGAPSSLISLRLANQMGILRETDGKLLIRAGGIGGSAPALLVVLDSLAMGEAKQDFVPATVVASLSDNFEGLLGMDFISSFNAKIDSSQELLVLTLPRPNRSRPAGHDEHWWRSTFKDFGAQRASWERFRTYVDERVAKSDFSSGPAIDALVQLRAVADTQVNEADRLLSRLDRHASNNSVPREWR